MLRATEQTEELDVVPSRGRLAVIGARPYAMGRPSRRLAHRRFAACCGNSRILLRCVVRVPTRHDREAIDRPARHAAGACATMRQMQLLAFDTATPATSVALLTSGGSTLTRCHEPAPGERPGHVSELLPLALELLAEAGIDFSQLDRLAVGIGPGTFTGLRIGVATARALAHAHDLPLVGVSTLRSLAAGAAGHVAGDEASATLAVLDARRGEAFAAAWAAGAAVEPAAEPLLAPAALTPDALAAAVATLPAGVLAVGDGAVRFTDVLAAAGAVVPADDSAAHRVDAAVHARLAAVMEPDARDAVLPAYLRLPDAELALRRRQATAS
jgi:tRNA threonylcarbamoyladenosine biosynthesis protein TsaB